MPGDVATARRWLLLGVLGAAALLWLSALLGLGTGRDRHAAVEASPLDFAEVDVDTHERLHALDTDADVIQRPLFTTDRRPQPFVLDAEGDTASAADFILTGVMMTPTLEMAILTPSDGSDPVRLRQGEELPMRPGWQLIQIAPRRVVLQTPEGTRELELMGPDG